MEDEEEDDSPQKRAQGSTFGASMADKSSYYDDDEEDDDYNGGSLLYADSGGETTIQGAIYNVMEESFDEITLHIDVVSEIQRTWAIFLENNGDLQASANILYASLFEAAPTLQSLFKTSRSVMSGRILAGFSKIVRVINQPHQLKIVVETMAFQHLDLEVTAQRVVIFRDAVSDMLEMELAEEFSSRAKLAWKSLLNYVGGAFAYVKANYAERLTIIARSWATANHKAAELVAQEEEPTQGTSSAALSTAVDASKELKTASSVEEITPAAEKVEVDGKAQLEKQTNSKEKAPTKERKQVGPPARDEHASTTKIPKTFNDMFVFNGAVMGFGSSTWMKEVLDSFDTIVSNVTNTYRLQEECDMVILRLSKYKGMIELSEFKAVMLASLRSLVPSDWDSAHEVAWVWLWENVERLLQSHLGRPQVEELALIRLLEKLTEKQRNYMRNDTYRRFFINAPAGQSLFKQSSSRLYWIADKVVEMTTEMYREPRKMFDEISAVGLRHVGYGVPTEFFSAYVTGSVEVFRMLSRSEDATNGFQWSLSLMSRMLVRVVSEGATMVMKAININSATNLRRAVAVAPRKVRAAWMLNVTVGTQSISPLYWAIERGALSVANAIIKDLLVIRADREKYYFGADDLFERHGDIIFRLCEEAKSCLNTLLDGLIWRSRETVDGQRRVNYYVKNLIIDSDGAYNKALRWLVNDGDPETICHPVVVLFSDRLWSGAASELFLFSRCWFLFSLSVFIVSKSILPHLAPSEDELSPNLLTVIFACRIFIYLGSLSVLLYNQIRSFVLNCRDRKNGFIHIAGVPLPRYLSDWKNAVSFFLVLAFLLMLGLEPMFHCIQSSKQRFTENCPAGISNMKAYSASNVIAMVLYWMLTVDISILSTKISAFVLVCGRVMPEAGLFLLALSFLIVSFATSVTSLDHDVADFSSVPSSALKLLELSLRMYRTDHFDVIIKEGFLWSWILAFSILVLAFVMNLLAAQLTSAYNAVFVDMVGYARLNRGKVTCQLLEGVSRKRWDRFVASCRFDQCLEFNEGDLGMPGGFQIFEAANLNPTTKDSILRVGGSNPDQPWPAEKDINDQTDDDFGRLESMLLKALKTYEANGGAAGRKGGKSVVGETGFSAASEDSDE